MISHAPVAQLDESAVLRWRRSDVRTVSGAPSFRSRVCLVLLDRCAGARQRRGSQLLPVGRFSELSSENNVTQPNTTWVFPSCEVWQRHRKHLMSLSAPVEVPEPVFVRARSSTASEINSARSSMDKSDRLLSGSVQVRILPGAPNCARGQVG